MSTNRIEGHFSGYDEIELFWQAWLVENPKATVIVTHGLGEHSESYTRLAEGLARHQIQLYCWDLRGHGKSPGKRGVVSSFDEYVRDLKLFVEYVRPRLEEKPFFLLGHSMGGLVTLKYLMRNGLGWAKGTILSSPLLGILLEVPQWKQKTARFLCQMTPELTLASGISDDKLTTDRKVLRWFETDSYRHDRCSTALYIGMLDNMKYANERADKVPAPILFQVSGTDKVNSAEKAKTFFEALPITDKKWITYSGMYHEIYNDLGREKTFEDLAHWINEHL